MGSKLSQSFGPRRVLHDVDVEVRPGFITVLLGPSGSGKTTLVRALSMLEPPSSGRIQVDETLYDFDSPHRGVEPPWPRITVVFQQLFLWPHLTLRENITLPLRKRGCDDALLDEVVTLFNMSEFLDRHPNQVSLGQRQRAALARAVLLQPSFLLLDEITSALDVEQANRLLGYLFELRQRSIGMLLVTHNIEFARTLLDLDEKDTFLFLDEGRVVERGEKDNFITPRATRFASFLASTGSIHTRGTST
ncbi:MAG: ATP-binding cassette domain-containing protein [Pseudomonadota bacterium]